MSGVLASAQMNEKRIKCLPSLFKTQVQNFTTQVKEKSSDPPTSFTRFILSDKIAESLSMDFRLVPKVPESSPRNFRFFRKIFFQFLTKWITFVFKVVSSFEHCWAKTFTYRDKLIYCSQSVHHGSLQEKKLLLQPTALSLITDSYHQGMRLRLRRWFLLRSLVALSVLVEVDFLIKF